MKKVMLFCSAIVFLTVVSISGCKKEMVPKESNNEATSNQLTKESKDLNSFARFSDNMNVSNYGHLIFSSPGDFGDYWEFVTTSTHEDVQEYLDSIGFNSPGATLYGEEYWDDRVSEEEAINYVFSEDQIFQVRDVLMKPINEVNEEVKWEFFLTMTEDNLSTSNYEALASGTYDNSIMNQFASNNDHELDLFGFIAVTPSGYAETTANSEIALGPGFGKRVTHVTVCGDSYLNGTNHCVRGCQRDRITKTYFFWINTSTEVYTESSWEQPATGC